MRVRTAEELGLAIRHRRTQLGLSQEDLARRIGVNRRWVQHVERGKQTVQLGLVLITLNELGVRLDLDARAAQAAESEITDILDAARDGSPAT